MLSNFSQKTACKELYFATTNHFYPRAVSQTLFSFFHNGTKTKDPIAGANETNLYEKDEEDSHCQSGTNVELFHTCLQVLH